MKFENWSTLLPLLTIVLIILGVYLQHDFYSYYSIDITKYLDPSEILFSFAPLSSLIVLLLWVLFLTAVQASWLSQSRTEKIFDGMTDALIEIKNLVSHKDELDRLRTVVNKYRELIRRVDVVVDDNEMKSITTSVRVLTFLFGLCFISLLSFGAFLVYQLVNSAQLYIASLIPALSLVFQITPLIAAAFMCGLLTVRHLRKTSKIQWPSFLSAITITFTFFFVLGSLTKNYLSATFLFKGLPQAKITVTYNNGNTFSSNDSICFINSSNRYYFFANRNDSTTIVLSKADMLKEGVVQLRKGF